MCIWGLLGLANAAEFCTSDNMLCLRTLIDPQVQDALQMEIQFDSTNGWAAVGLGRSMSDADIYLGYLSSDNELFLHQRKSTSQSLPDKVNDSNLLSFASGIQNGKTFYRFQVPLSGQGIDRRDIPNENTDLIWAYNDNINDIAGDGDLAQHTRFGSFSLNLLSESSATASASPDIVHGYLMMISWLILAPFGIFIAAFLKAKLGVWWFRLHALIFTVAFIAILAAFGIIVDFKGDSPHFATAHGIIGLVVIILTSGQVLLGVVIDQLWDPERDYIPWHDKLHWWQGRILYILAAANVIIGFLGLSMTASAIASGVLLALFIVIMGFSKLAFKGSKGHENDPYTEDESFTNVTHENYQHEMNEYEDYYGDQYQDQSMTGNIEISSPIPRNESYMSRI